MRFWICTHLPRSHWTETQTSSQNKIQQQNCPKRLRTYENIYTTIPSLLIAYRGQRGRHPKVITNGHHQRSSPTFFITAILNGHHQRSSPTATTNGHHLRRQAKTVDPRSAPLEGHRLPLHRVVQPDALHQLPIQPGSAHLRNNFSMRKRKRHFS